MKSFKLLVTFTFTSLLLVACTVPVKEATEVDGAIVEGSVATDTLQSPMATLEPTKTATTAPTLTPTAFIPTLDSAGISPVEPSDLAITSDNFQRIEILTELGKGRLNDAAISPDGTTIAAATTRGVYLYDSANLQEFAFLDAGSTSLVEFGPEGDFLIADLEIWDLDTLDSVRFLGGGSRFIGGAISPNGNYLATTAEIREGGDPLFFIQVWDLRTGKHIFAFQEIGAYFTDISFSPDSAALLVAGSFGRPTIFDVQSGEVVFEFEDGNRGAAFSPDGETLLLSDGRVWDLANEEFEEGFDEQGFNVGFSPDGSRAIFYSSYVGSGAVTVWDVASREKVYDLDVSGVTNMSISDDQQLLVTPTNGEIRTWDFNTGQLLGIIDGFTRGFNVMEFGMANSIVAVGGYDGELFLWNTQSSELLMTYKTKIDNISDLALFSNDQLIAALGQEYGEDLIPLDLWGIESGQLLYTADDVCSVNANQDLLAISDNNGVEIINLRTGMVEGLLPASCLRDIVLSSDGKTLVGYDREVRVSVYDVASGEMLWSTGIEDDENAYIVEELALSSDDRYLAGAGINGTVYLWDLISGTLLYSLDAHDHYYNEGYQAGAHSVAFSPNGSLLVSVGVGNTIAFWDPTSGEELGRLDLIPDIGTIRFSRDGQHLALAGDSSGVIYLFGLLQ